MRDEDILNASVGYCDILAEGLKTECFLNDCVKSGIVFKHTQKLSYTKIRFRIYSPYLRRLKKIAAESGCKITILKKGGISGIFSFLKRRFLVLPLIAAIAIFLFYSSCFVWKIEVSGCENTDKFAVMDYAQDMGLYEGNFIGGVDKEKICEGIKKNFDNIAWVNIYFDGTDCHIDIVEGIAIPDIVKEQGVGNIYAKKDGYIVDMRVFSGDGIAKTNTTVKKGDLLISGDVVRDEKVIMHTLARGEVTAKVWTQGSARGSLYENVEKRTGREYNAKCIEINGGIYFLQGAENKFETYETQILKETTVGENMPFSFEIYEVKIFETKKEQSEKDDKILQTELEEQAYKNALAQVENPSEITGVKTYISKTDDEMTARVIIETTEEIGCTVEN